MVSVTGYSSAASLPCSCSIQVLNRVCIDEVSGFRVCIDEVSGFRVCIDEASLQALYGKCCQ